MVQSPFTNLNAEEITRWKESRPLHLPHHTRVHVKAIFWNITLRTGKGCGSRSIGILQENAGMENIECVHRKRDHYTVEYGCVIVSL
jgi:hypothetical protein